MHVGVLVGRNVVDGILLEDGLVKDLYILGAVLSGGLDEPTVAQEVAMEEIGDLGI